MVSRYEAFATNRNFDRRIIQRGERMLIESTCRYCVAVIVGSVTDALAADEATHIQQCRKKR